VLWREKVEGEGREAVGADGKGNTSTLTMMKISRDEEGG